MKNTILLSIAAAALLSASCAEKPSDFKEIPLSGLWMVQSSAVVAQDGAGISSPEFQPEGWHPASVPSTVMGTLTANGLYSDLFVGRNYEEASREPFDVPWWYRTAFRLDPLAEDRRAVIEFDGISYRADIWLNGNLVAPKEEAYGTYRRLWYDITEYVGEDNVLAVEVFRAREGEPNIGFVDWNPRPLDENMGIFRPVRVTVTGGVAMRDTWVRTDVDPEPPGEAQLTIQTDLYNLTDREVSGRLAGRIEERGFSVPVTLAPGEKRTVAITPGQSPALRIRDPRLWWSHDQGTPELYELDLRFETCGRVSARDKVAFGIRSVGDYFTEDGHRGFTLNGRKVLILGGGWADDIFLADTPERNELQVRYVRDMGLNAIRFEGIWGNSRNIYELCDRYGIMALAGWSCHWEWEEYAGAPEDGFGTISSEHDMDLAVRYLDDQVRWLRNSPSIVAWYVGSDKLPRPALERRYRALLEEIDPTRPCVGSATEAHSEVSGPVGMKMRGPYEYVSPVYWFADTRYGGAFGFNTETGPGPQFPTRESIERMIHPDSLWPLSAEWDYHTTAGKHAFNNLDVINRAMDAKYGPPRDLDDYLRKGQLMNYEATRSMFEAFRLNRGKATGVVQWMLDSAWPSVFWQLYDWYMVPVPAYYGVKNANKPLQLIYDYADNCVYAVNGTRAAESLTAVVEGWSPAGAKLFERKVAVDVPADASAKAVEVDNSAPNTLLWLGLYRNGEPIAGNFYVLSSRGDVYAWDETDWVGTPIESYADFTGLQDMPPAALRYNVKKEGNGLRVDVENTSGVPALFVELLAKDPAGAIVVPSFWNDNYVSIPPGGRRTIECGFDTPDIEARAAALQVKGWNVPRESIPLREAGLL